MRPCIAIIGLGLIGGSLALALKENYRPTPFIIAIDRDTRSLEEAIRLSAVDLAASSPGAELEQADIVFLATPVLQIVPIVEAILPFLKPGAIISDVGSTKQFVKEQLGRILPDTVHYVGGHPMAGREKSGFQAVTKDLFRDKWYILIADAATEPAALAAVHQTVESVGARIAVMDALIHDQCAAVISHVPHVAAAAMVNLLDFDLNPDTSMKLAAGGFRDTTRIASSDADMWADICISNAGAMLSSLKNFQYIISEVIQAIEQGDRDSLHRFFTAAKKRRDSMLPEIGQ